MTPARKFKSFGYVRLCSIEKLHDVSILQERNIHGHSSESSIQHLMYFDRQNSAQPDVLGYLLTLEAMPRSIGFCIIIYFRNGVI